MTPAGTRMRFPLGLIVLLVLTACESPEGLQPVEGVAGRLEFTGAWPDSIQAAALVILDPAALQDAGNIGAYILSYSNPVDSSSHYFIQLRPGGYIGVVVGLTIDPGLFAANLDSYLAQPTLPLVMLSLPNQGGLYIPEGRVMTRNWLVAFD